MRQEQERLIAGAERDLHEGEGAHAQKTRQTFLLASIAKSMLALAKMALEEREG